jgi:predicted enzyme related to lactoylglutathione lyase
MKFIVLLKADSPAMSRQFYEDELGLFKLQGELWDSACTMQAIYSDEFGIELTTYNRAPAEEPAFTLIVPDCAREFARLRATSFGSGARIVPNKDGVVEIFEYPAGKNFMMEDPSGNRFMIHEDYRPDAVD